MKLSRAVARKICAIGEAKICAPPVRISYQQLETQKNTDMISQGNWILKVGHWANGILISIIRVFQPFFH
jgi:hypothetical protein